MSDQPHPRRQRSNSMPPLVWGLLGLLLVALFVLALLMLHPAPLP
jgi:hypothetical protein